MRVFSFVVGRSAHENVLRGAELGGIGQDDALALGEAAGDLDLRDAHGACLDLAPCRDAGPIHDPSAAAGTAFEERSARELEDAAARLEEEPDADALALPQARGRLSGKNDDAFHLAVFHLG